VNWGRQGASDRILPVDLIPARRKSALIVETKLAHWATWKCSNL